MPDFNTVEDESQWLDQMACFLEEDANFLRGKYADARWAQRKIQNYEAIAEYLQEVRSGLDEEGESEVPPLSGEPPL